MMDESDRRLELSYEQISGLIETLSAPPKSSADIERSIAYLVEEHMVTVDAILELARDPDPNWYYVVVLIADVFCVNYDHYLVDSYWEYWCIENDLPMEVIAKHMEIYAEMTGLRRIPLEKYAHLSADLVEAILKPLLPVEPTVPAIRTYWPSAGYAMIKWLDWERKLLSRINAG